MIYITGDTHGDIDNQKLKSYFAKRYVTREDYLLILGDVAIVWSEIDDYIYEYEWLGPTIIYIDGNHENFELLNQFPVVEYKGARCHRITKNIYHVLRGEIIDINGLSLFCMGGATSIDKHLRENHISWWEEENITDEDVLNGLNNLKKVDYQVEYVLTHAAPSSVVKKMFGYKTDSNTELLENFKKKIIFNHWYFGHYHQNKKYGKYRCFYEDILEIPAMKTSKKKINAYLYVRSGDYDDYDKYPYLINWKTGRKTSLKEEDLPEWFYHGYSYRDWYYCLKNVTDVAFIPSPFDNHISKDSRIYLHYHGKLKKTKDYRPLHEEEWDVSTWRCSIAEVCLGLEKYSPHLDLKRLKAGINLVYDQYNNGNGGDIVVRPFPEITTPHFVDKWGEKKAEYVVLKGNDILSEFINFDRADRYAKEYVNKYLKNELCREISGDEYSGYIKAFAYNLDFPSWIFIKKIEP